MENIVRHMVTPIVSRPDDVSVQSVETDDGVVIELVVHPDDRDRILDDRHKTLRAIRTIVSAAAGRSRASLELVDAHGEGAEE